MIVQKFSAVTRLQECDMKPQCAVLLENAQCDRYCIAMTCRNLKNKNARAYKKYRFTWLSKSGEDIRIRFFTPRVVELRKGSPKQCLWHQPDKEFKKCTMLLGTWCDSWSALCRARNWTQ